MFGQIISKIPWFRDAYLYRKNCSGLPGSYLSPVVDIDYIKQNEEHLWPKGVFDLRNYAGIEMNEEDQSKLMEELRDVYKNLDLEQFEKTGKDFNRRFYFDNTWYVHADATALFMMMMRFRPKRIIEIGSGFSSALMLDINNSEFDNTISLTFIEPNPERLESVITEKDESSAKIVRGIVQDVPVNIYEELDENDILFVDNSHVCKVGSDVNHVFFEILPRLKKGVIIHIHDIFFPFMYPKRWLIEGERKENWNEIFILRAFLMYNSAFEVLFFPDYMIKKYPEEFLTHFPYLCKSENQTIWLRKK